MSEFFYAYKFKAKMFVPIIKKNQQSLRIEHSIIIAMIYSGKGVHYSCREAVLQHDPPF